MAATTVVRPSTRAAAGVGMFIALSLVHGFLLLAVPSASLIALLLWWNANTVSHNFIHRPFFRSRIANRAYAAYLSLLLGVPQSQWRARHLAHHAARSGKPHRRRAAGGWAWTEVGLVVAMWAGIAVVAPRFFLTVYVPGYVAGLGLCWLQGHFEHAGGATSHYGRLYNAAFFNDGYHVEHHERPQASWTELPAFVRSGARQSRWPPVLRWLDSLERVVLWSSVLQHFVVARHERALRALFPMLPSVSRVTVVGGGLFPRTAVVLKRVMPWAAVTLVDMHEANLGSARRFLDASVRLECRQYDPRRPEDADLVIIPLAFHGDRSRLYRHPNAAAVLIHDWLWVRHQPSARVSWLLVKRLNLVRR
jgi:fatty acid desaturase